MAWTEFAARAGGSNLNAGTRTGSSTEPGTSADLTYASGSWVQSTCVFTVSSGDPIADGVAVGDFCSVYPDGSTTGVFVGRVTARTTTTITVSTTAKMGTSPADGTSNRTLKIGGAWLGPNGADGWPLNTDPTALQNSSAHPFRCNLKNDATYSITAAITIATNGKRRYQGYTSSYGDGGRFVLDGGTSGASYVLLTISAIYPQVFDAEFRNNGATGSANGLTVSSSRVLLHNVVAHDLRGSGISLAGTAVYAQECEAYACNQSNTANLGGFSGAGTYFRCISHDNAGSNSAGFNFTTSAAMLAGCVADSNGGAGFNFAGTDSYAALNCDAYNNASHGFNTGNSSGVATLDSCNAAKNGGYGAALTSGAVLSLYNCGFGSGTQANTSGTVQAQAASMVEEVGTVNYPADVTPWADPATGDFRLVLAQAIGAGRGTYTQTASSYAGTVGYPDIGAAQHRPRRPRAAYQLGV